jgi:hypothetical protein
VGWSQNKEKNEYTIFFSERESWRGEQQHANSAKATLISWWQWMERKKKRIMKIAKYFDNVTKSTSAIMLRFIVNYCTTYTTKIEDKYAGERAGIRLGRWRRNEKCIKDRFNVVRWIFRLLIIFYRRQQYLSVFIACIQRK